MKTQFIGLAAITLDGKLARTTHHISFGWTSKEDEKFFKNYVDKCDAIIVGRNTYEMSQAIIRKRKRNCIVFSHLAKGIEVKHDRLTHMKPTKQSLKKLCEERGYKKVAVLGGTGVYDYFIKEKMLDVLYLTIEPVIFGAGVPLLSASTNAKVKVESVKKLNKKGTVLAKVVF